MGDAQRTIPTFFTSIAVLLTIFVIYQFAFYPIVAYDDKSLYLNLFKNSSVQSIVKAKDIGFGFYTYLNRILYSSANLYFIITALCYVGGYWIFAIKNIDKKYIFVFLLMIFSSFGFTAYGINTIRAGFALSMLLIALAYHKNLTIFIIFSLFAVLSHKATAIPLAAFIASGYVFKHKIYLMIWFAAFLLSFLNIGFISSFLQENVFSFDDRSADYFTAENSVRYKTGFRLDFAIYSIIPIAISYYFIFKLKLKDIFYSRIFNTYLLTNAIWLFVIRMAFTDRVAYLSWFLIPFLIIYPLLKYRLPLNQRNWLAVSLCISLAFTVYMHFK